jgi:S1-C subfamily serine protease
VATVEEPSDRPGLEEHTVSDTPEFDWSDESGWRSPSSTATLSPPPWTIPTSGDGGAAGTGLGFGTEGPAGPPPRRPSRNAVGLLVSVLVVALIAFLSAGPLHLRAGNNGIDLSDPRQAFGTPYSPPTTDTSPSTASSSTASWVQAVATKVDKGLVNINTELGFQNGQAAGTGMILTSSGEVLTNNHVIQGSTKIIVTVVDSGKSYAAHVVGTDPSDDVAVIQIEGVSGLKTVSTARASTVSVGDDIVAIGNAGGRGGTPTASAGNVTALGQSITASDDDGSNAEQLTDLIEINAPIEPGDSGGALANRNGEVIGMNSAAEVSRGRGGFRSPTTTGLGYAIPIDNALTIAHQIESGQAGGNVHIGLPAFLGVQIAGTGTARSGRTPAPTATGGALISGVEPDTAADSIGLAAGDMITSVNGRTVDSPSALTAALQTARPGDKVAIGWTDSNGAKHTAQAILSAGPAD